MSPSYRTYVRVSSRKAKGPGVSDGFEGAKARRRAPKLATAIIFRLRSHAYARSRGIALLVVVIAYTVLSIAVGAA